MWVIYIDLYKSGMSFCSSHGSETCSDIKLFVVQLILDVAD